MTAASERNVIKRLAMLAGPSDELYVYYSKVDCLGSLVKGMRVDYYNINLLPYKIVAWICLLFFLFCTVMAWMAGQFYAAFGLFLFTSLGAIMLVLASRFYVSDEGISVFSSFAEYRLRWDEVVRAELGGQGTLVFYGGGDKRLMVPPFSYWSGADKHQALEFISQRLDDLGIELVSSYLADFKVHKNVRVS